MQKNVQEEPLLTPLGHSHLRENVFLVLSLERFLIREKKWVLSHPRKEKTTEWGESWEERRKDRLASAWSFPGFGSTQMRQHPLPHHPISPTKPCPNRNSSHCWEQRWVELKNMVAGGSPTVEISIHHLSVFLLNSHLLSSIMSQPLGSVLGTQR